MPRLLTLGGLRLEQDATDGGAPGVGPEASRARPLALLTVLAEAGAAGRTRDQLCALFWPEADAEHARNALSQLVFTLRRALRRPDALLADASGTLRLDPAHVASDLRAFEDALADRAPARAVAAYGGPFLDGFHLKDAPGFAAWADGVRARLAAAYADALEAVAAGCAASNDAQGAAAAWRRRAALDPLSERVALALVRALAGAGDVAAALAQARVYEALLRAELDAAPTPAFARAVASVLDGASAATPPGAVGASTPDIPPGSGGLTVAPPVVGVPDGGRALPPAGADRPGGGTAAGARTGQERTEHTRAGRERAGRWRAAVLTLAGASVFGAVSLQRFHPLAARTLEQGASSDVHPASARVALASWRAAGADPALRALSAGLPDLLAPAFSDPPVHAAPDALRAADTARDTTPPAAFAWRVVRPDDGAPLSDEPAALAWARARQVSHLLSGTVTSTGGGRIVLHAVLTGVRDGRPTVTATVAGPADSVGGLAARLASELLARDAGEPPDHVAELAAAPPAAVRAYLAGRAAYRAGRFAASEAAFAVAAQEAPALTLAAVWWAAAANWTGDRTTAKQAIASAWPARFSLAPADRAYLVGLAGPGYPGRATMRARFGAWQDVTRLAPDRPDGWHELGEAYFHQAEWLGLPHAWANARLAFEHALELDPAYEPARMHLAQLFAEAGDADAVRAQAAWLDARDPATDAARYVRWRLAHLVGDGGAARALSDTLAASPGQGTRWLLETGVEDAVGLDEAEHALAVREGMAATNAERVELARARHSLALVRGRPAAAAAAVRHVRALEPEDVLDARFDVVAALYEAGSPAGAAGAAAELAARAIRDRGRTPPAAALDTARQAACVAGQWAAARADTAGARRMRAVLTGSGADDGHARACRLLLDAAVARSDGARRAARDTLDRLLVDGVEVGRLEPYFPLAVARTHLRAGDSTRAAAAVRRISYFGRWPYYLGAQLALDADLALARGDTAGAWCALRHRAALRGAPEPALRRDADATRARLAALARAWAPGRGARADVPTRAAACRRALGDLGALDAFAAPAAPAGRRAALR